MDQITADDFEVTEQNAPGSILDAYDHANATGGDTDSLVEPYHAEVERILVERPSPAAVADALARHLEGPGGPAEAAAWWLAKQL